MLLVITLSKDDNMQSVVQYVNKPIVRLDWDRDDMSDMLLAYSSGEYKTRIAGVDPMDITAVWFRIAYLSPTSNLPMSHIGCLTASLGKK